MVKTPVLEPGRAVRGLLIYYGTSCSGFLISLLAAPTRMTEGPHRIRAPEVVDVENMERLTLEMATESGFMGAFVTYPDEGGPFPLIVMLMDAYGWREELCDMASRLATVGHCVVLPNLYYRSIGEFDATMDPVAGVELARSLMGTISSETVISDLRAVLGWAGECEDVDNARVGLVGYCMSGPYVLDAAIGFAESVRAAAVIYGVRLFEGAAASDLASQIDASLYFACAELDGYAPPDMIEALHAHLDRLNIDARFEWYPGAKHGFAFPSRLTYDKGHAERHWERLHSLFNRCL
jgi:carboxymethylenebutenolidase